MRRHILVAILTVLGSFTSSWAQLYAPNAAGVAMGHLHYNVKNVEVARTFWMELGAQPVMLGTLEVLKFPGVMVLLTQADSSGESEGSVVNHVAFRVPNVLQWLERLKAAGYKTRLSNIGAGKVGSVYGPEDERVELMEDLSEAVKFVPDTAPYVAPSKMTVPIMPHHIHLFVPEDDISEVKAWYVKFFDAVPGKRYKMTGSPYEAADLPGVNLNFTGVNEQLVPTKGRRLDHIGFEIKDLEEFCRRLETMGVEFDQPYTRHSSGLSTAFLTDPWGVSIELTEGFR